jgi:tetratricopeptide (TPR) repeat protein
MQSKLIYLMIGLLGGLITGFIVTNTINRSEIDKLHAEIKKLQVEQGNSRPKISDNSMQRLSNEEIRQAIIKADAEKEDSELQKKLGLALYNYLMHEPNSEFLPDVVKILKRAHQTEPNNRGLLIALGNTLFELGQSIEPKYFNEARLYYLKAVELKSDDIDVRTRLGQTYYFGEPSDINRAISEYRQALSVNSKYEPALQNLASALISLGKTDEAQAKIEELEKLNSANPSLVNLRAQLIQSRNAN